MPKQQPVYLVTGGAGFIGSHVIDELLKRKKRIVLIDDFSNGTLRNISHIRNQIVIIRGDITWPLARLRKIFQPFSLQGIFHLACRPRSLSLLYPQRDLEVNAMGTLHMLQIAQQHSCKMVFTSTSGIFGNPKYLPMDEKHPDQPSTPYDANKLVGEYFCKIYSSIHHVPVAIVRLATVYGDRQRSAQNSRALVTEFMTNALRNRPSIIEGNGRQTRDLIYVKDAVLGIVDAFFGKTDNSYYLISSNTEVSVNQLYATIQQMVKNNIAPIRKSVRLGDLRRMRLSFRRAQLSFGFRPRYDLHQGIQELMTWYLSQYPNVRNNAI